MRTIRLLAKDIECNIDEAEDKIETAYALKEAHPAMAVWYKEMALAHLGFNGKGHDLVAAEITAYKGSAEYSEHREYADAMQDVWNDKHTEIVSKAARVRAMIDSFK